MKIIKVDSKKDKKDFIELSCLIYNNDENWIRPLDKDINSVFDPKKNKAFRKGDITRWILKNNNKTINKSIIKTKISKISNLLKYIKK